MWRYTTCTERLALAKPWNWRERDYRHLLPYDWGFYAIWNSISELNSVLQDDRVMQVWEAECNPYECFSEDVFATIEY